MDDSSTAATGSTLKRWGPALLVLLVTVGVHGSSLECGFTWDDRWLIVDNELVHDIGRAGELVFGQDKIWRPLKRLSFAVDHALWGLDPRGFHRTNVALMLASCLAVLAFARRLGLSRGAACFASLLFCVHPVHVEAVANISHRKEPMALLFYLLAFLAWLGFRDADEQASRIGGGSLPRRLGLLTLSWCFFVLGMLSKEVAVIMFPALVIAHELALAGDGLRSRMRRILIFLGPGLVALIPFIARGYLGRLPSYLNAETVHWVTRGRTADYSDLLLTAIKAFGAYVGMLGWPSPLYLDRSFPVAESFGEREVIMGSLALAAFLFGLVVSWKRSRLCFFALLWFGVNLVPVLNIIPLTQWLIAERFVFVPSLGACLLAAIGVNALWGSASQRGHAMQLAVLSSAAVLLIGLTTLTAKQTGVWKNDGTLWAHTLKYNPRSFRALHGRGLHVHAQGSLDEAEELFRRALTVNPAYPEARYALALLLQKGKRHEEALAQALRHSRSAPGETASLMIAGKSALALGRRADALSAYEEALRRNPRHGAAALALARTLLREKRLDEALVAVRTAISVRDRPACRQLEAEILSLLPPG